MVSTGCKTKTILFIDLWGEGREREREREKERKKEYEKMNGLLFHLFMHSLVDSYMCPDQGLNLQHWHIGTML